MQESSTKTTLKQRIIFIIVACVLLFSTVAVYILTVFGKEDTGTSSDKVTNAEIEAYLADYESKSKKLSELTDPYSSDYLERMIGYKSQIKGFNKVTANESGVQAEDIVEGDGEKLTSSSAGYGAYYIGWCSDETVFDSSFDNFDTPGKLKAPIIVEPDALVAGWYQGLDGMHLGGTRIITIPGNLAYGDSYNPCDNSSDERNIPLRFLITTFSITDELRKLSSELQEAYLRYMYASMYGMKYE